MFAHHGCSPHVLTRHEAVTTANEQKRHKTKKSNNGKQVVTKDLTAGLSPLIYIAPSLIRSQHTLASSHSDARQPFQLCLMLTQLTRYCGRPPSGWLSHLAAHCTAPCSRHADGLAPPAEDIDSWEEASHDTHGLEMV